VLNFLEVACGAIDVALLVLIAVVYRIQAQQAEVSAMTPPPGMAQPPPSSGQQQEELALPQVSRLAPHSNDRVPDRRQLA
jgi:hypothetical protein